MKKRLILLILLLSCLFKFVEAQNNSIQTLIRYEYFKPNIKDRIFISTQYGYNFNQKHQIYLTSTNIIRGNKNGYKFQADYYPVYNKGYMFFNFGYSNSSIVPDLNAAAEIYRTVFKNFEVSLGGRYIKPPVNEIYNLFSLTSTIGIYYGNYFTYIRPTLSFLENGISWSSMVETRKYFNSSKSYLSISLIKGFNDNSNHLNSVENEFGLNNYSVNLKLEHSLPKNYIINITADYSAIYLKSRENFISLYGSNVSLKKKF